MAQFDNVMNAAFEQENASGQAIQVSSSSMDAMLNELLLLNGLEGVLTADQGNQDEGFKWTTEAFLKETSNLPTDVLRVVKSFLPATTQIDLLLSKTPNALNSKKLWTFLTADQCASLWKSTIADKMIHPGAGRNGIPKNYPCDDIANYFPIKDEVSYIDARGTFTTYRPERNPIINVIRYQLACHEAFTNRYKARAFGDAYVALTNMRSFNAEVDNYFDKVALNLVRTAMIVTKVIRDNRIRREEERNRRAQELFMRRNQAMIRAREEDKAAKERAKEQAKANAKAAKEQAKAQAKAAKEQAKAQAKAAKEQAKANAKAAKKLEKEQAKAALKLEKEQAKAQAKAVAAAAKLELREQAKAAKKLESDKVKAAKKLERERMNAIKKTERSYAALIKKTLARTMKENKKKAYTAGTAEVMRLAQMVE